MSLPEPAPAAPQLEFFARLEVALDPIREMGAGRAGQRRIIPITGGTVKGPAISGTILNLGADWQTIFADGGAELDTRYAMETDDGALIEIVNFGYRNGPPEIIAALARGEEVDPQHYYMRTHALLETGHPRYAWVNQRLFVGSGMRQEQRVIVDLFMLA